MNYSVFRAITHQMKRFISTMLELSTFVKEIFKAILINNKIK